MSEADEPEAAPTAEETGDSTAEVADSEHRMRRAIRQVRREGWKVAVIYAVVDAALVTVLANLVLSVFSLPSVPERVPIPSAALAAIEGALGVTLSDPTVQTGAVVGVALGAVAFAIEFGLRVRRPLVEQFEAVNDDLRESLRTARDSVADGSTSRMAARLYEDVLADLREASSVGLVDLRRVSGTVLLVVIVGLASIHLAVVDLAFIGGGPGDGGPTGDGSPSEFEGLRDPSSILGEPEDVPAGEQNQEATIDTSGSGGDGGADAESPASYENSGFVNPESVESQRAEFSEQERLEDAELIREYNIRIREEE